MMARMYQDFSFTVAELVDRPLVRLRGCLADLDALDMSPSIVYARLADPAEWHCFWLELGAGFWASRTDADIEELQADESYRLVEYLSDTLPMTIKSARAVEPGPGWATRISIELSDGTELVLRCKDDLYDGEAEFHITTRSGG